MSSNENQEYVILLGGNILNKGIVDYCKIHNKKVVIVDWSHNIHLKGDLFLCIDVKDSSAVIKALKEQGIVSICGAYSSIDLAVPTINSIHKEYGLSFMDNDTISHVMSKSAMTEIWKKNGLLNRFSRVLEEFENNIIELSQNFKLIFKPNVSSSSRGITIIQKGSETSVIISAFNKAKLESYDSKVIIEEFIEGREFTCEMLGDNYGNVCVYAISTKYHTLNTCNNKIATKLHYNSNYYSDDIYNKIADIGKKCYKSLGLKSSFGHLEIILKDEDTFSPIEIGARSSGYIASSLVSLASGHDYFGDYLNVLSGMMLRNNDYLNSNMSSMYFFYDMPHDTQVSNPCCLMDFLPNTIKSIDNNRLKILQKGYKFSDINNDNERVGFEILYGEKSQIDIRIIEKAEQEFIKANTCDGIL